MFVKDAALVYRAVSRPFAHLAGEENAEAVEGRSDPEIFGGPLAERYRADDLRAMDEGSVVDYIEPMPGENMRRCITSKYAVRDGAGRVIGVCGVSRDVTAQLELCEKNRRLEAEATLDELTGVLNRGAAVERIRQSLVHRRKTDGCALLFIDLDRFKEINDSMGHPFGDTVLKETAARLRETFRREDILGRVGGDEFIVLMRNVESCEDILQRISRVFEILPRVSRPDGGSVQISCSIGVAMCREGKSLEQLYTEADRAMYAAKSKGKNRVEFCNG